MTYSYTKVQGQRSVGSKDRVETNERMDGQKEVIALPPTLMRPVINGYVCTKKLPLKAFVKKM